MYSMKALHDDQGRVYRKLRLSVTDRCQFRCVYCMPEGPTGGNWLPKDRLLSYEEIGRFVTLLQGVYGIADIRITGGEPLLRRDLAKLVGNLRAVPGLHKLSLTTNGVLLPTALPDLAAAGLDAVTVSIDSLAPSRFQKLSGGGDLDAVLAGIDALAKCTDVAQKKLNAVIVRGENDDELEALVRFGAARRMEMRFIEYMPFGAPWGWDGVMTKTDMLAQIQKSFGALESLPVDHGSTSRRWRIPALDNYVFGIIPTMGETLCAECDRLRLTADGRVLNCLFDAEGVGIRDALRAEDDDAIRRAIELHMARKGVGFLAANRRTANIVPLDHMHRVGG